MLENLCLRSIRDSSELECMDDFSRCAGSSEIKNLSKGQSPGLLINETEKHQHIEVDALSGYWNFDHHCFKEFVGFLKHFL